MPLLTTGAGGYPAIGGGPSYQGPGDVVSGATAWVSSARAYNAAFAAGVGPIMDIVDSSNANPATINILSTGFVDLTTLNAWIVTHGAASVKKLYDQTGNGNHFTQATVGNMPTITQSALNGLPGLTFAQASARTINTASISFALPFTMSGVYKRTSGTNGDNLLAGQGSGQGFGPATTANLASIFGGSEVTVAATDNSFHALEGVQNGGSSAIVADGTVASGNAGLGAITAVALRLGRSAGGLSLDGIIMEGGIWGSLAMTTGGGSQTDLLNTNQHSASNGYNF